MSRTLGANAAMIASRNHHRALCIRIETNLGDVYTFTNHDRALAYALPGIAFAPESYSPRTGILASEIVLATGLDVDSCEIIGPIGQDISAAQVLGKSFNKAQVWIFDVDWRNPAAGHIPYLFGCVADSTLEGRKFIFEIRSDFDRFNQAIGRILAPYCTADFGDAQCGVVKLPYVATITAVIDDFNFNVDLTSEADDFFNLGTIEFYSGALAGIQPIEVFDFVGASGLIQLFVPTPVIPQVGDDVILYQGCSKIKASSDPALPTCHFYDNVLNFRGFDRVPGSDNYLKVPTPGSPPANAPRLRFDQIEA